MLSCIDKHCLICFHDPEVDYSVNDDAFEDRPLPPDVEPISEGFSPNYTLRYMSSASTKVDQVINDFWHWILESVPGKWAAYLAEKERP